MAIKTEIKKIEIKRLRDKSVFFRLISIFYFLFAIPFMLAQEPDLNIEPSSMEDTSQHHQIRDKLLTNLFFRGELADKIIEAGLHNKLIEFSGDETRSDIRAELIRWIGRHPDEAARLFLQLKGGAGGFAFEEIPMHSVRYELNPFFLELAKNLVTASQNTSLSDEELSMASKRLFEGIPHTEDRVIMTQQKSKIQQTIGTNFFYSDYADFKIDQKTLGREQELISSMFKQIQSGLEADKVALKQHSPSDTGKNLPGQGIYDADSGITNQSAFMEKYENSIIFAKRENLFKQTFQMYQDFLITISSFKGRKNITKKESDLIEKERHLLREKFALLHALSRIYELNLHKDILLKNSPGSDFQNIIQEILNLKRLFTEYVSAVENTQMQLSHIYARLRSIEELLFNWTVKFVVYDKFARMKMSIENLNFSCVLDRMISGYLMKFFPASGYAKTRNEILEFSVILDSSVKEISAGNFDNAFNLMTKDMVAPVAPSASWRSAGPRSANVDSVSPGKVDMAFEKIRNIDAKIQVISDFSKFNENVQFIFWDMFFNPFKIKYERRPEQNKLKISNSQYD